jgi:hypothetical protein
MIRFVVTVGGERASGGGMQRGTVTVEAWSKLDAAARALQVPAATVAWEDPADAPATIDRALAAEAEPAQAGIRDEEV